jgi:hypothetical protein
MNRRDEPAGWCHIRFIPPVHPAGLSRQSIPPAGRATLQDKRRSARGLVNRTGSWVAAWRYRAYGAGLDRAGTVAAGLKRFRWAGAQ